MTGDYSRLTYKPESHYRSVRLQQGRVQLDADWNEQVDIQAHQVETTLDDELGPSGAPISQAGFALTLQGADVQIGAGRYYVDGILCESEAAVAFTAQPDLPGVTRPTQAATYLAYLDVWERQLTALERPELREAALGGPDTATRGKTVWQVKLEQVGDANANVACSTFGTGWAPANSQSSGQLKAQPKAADQTPNACPVPATGGYRRLDNQLYRVEIHTPGAAGTATFVWSRDNGSVATRLEGINGDDLTVADPGKDAVLAFAGDQWVELRDEGRVLRGEPGILVQLHHVQGDVLTIKAWPNNTALTMADFGAVPTVRRWDSPGEVVVSTADPIDLGDDGVQVQFAAGDYRTGDFWTIPARTQTLERLADSNVIGGIDWPRDTNGPLFQPLQGIMHHYAPLGLLRFDGTNWTVLSDCRHLFPAATELVGLFYVGGDGQEARPGNPLPQLLQVGVFNGSWAVSAATVQFAAPGAGKVGANTAALASATNALTITTGADGIASCIWLPDPATNSQQLVATLTSAGGNSVGAAKIIRFNANLSVASEVAYNPTDCATLSGVTNVQDALTKLCQTVGRDPGMLVKEVRLIQPDQPLRNDTAIPPNALIGGLRVVVDQPVDLLAIRAKPVGAVTLELPFPVAPSDRDFWNAPAVVGFQPLILAGEFVAGGNVIAWRPSPATQAWLNGGLQKALLAAQQTAPLLAYFTLKGNFIWAQQNPDIYLDGETFGLRGANGGTIDVRFTGDGRRGGNLEMWFFLQLEAPPPALTLQGFTLAPPIVASGAPSFGILTLSGPAGANGATITVASSDPQVAVAPASVVIPANQNTTRFQIATTPNPLPTPRIAVISATFAGTTMTAQLTVRLG